MKKITKEKLVSTLGVLGGLVAFALTAPYVSKYIIKPIDRNLRQVIMERQGRTTYAEVGDFSGDSKEDVIIHHNASVLTSDWEAYVGVGNGKLIPYDYAERLAEKQNCSVDELVKRIVDVSEEGVIKFKGK